MTTPANTNKQPPATANVSYTTDFVTSQDGTTIGYRQLGHGPGVVLLHGAMESSQSHMELAQALADAYSVYLPDRRGRGLSGPYSKDHSIQKDVEDISAILTKTGAHYAFGVSSGGLIMLQAALTLPAISKVALYDPVLIVNGSASTAFLARYDREMAQGNVAAALITGMKGAQMGPAFLNFMPRWLLESFTSKGMAQEEKTAKADDVTMRKLAPTLHYDFTIVAEMAETLDRFKAMRPDVLLLGGGKSPKYLKVALNALEKTLPHVQRMEFSELGHGGSSDASNMIRDSKPELVAQALHTFFA